MPKGKEVASFQDLKSLWNATHKDDPAAETGYGLRPRKPRRRRKKDTPNPEKKWIIHDWAGNHKFPDKEFSSFDEGVAFIQEKFAKVEDREEFYVVTKNGKPDRE